MIENIFDDIIFGSYFGFLKWRSGEWFFPRFPVSTIYEQITYISFSQSPSKKQTIIYVIEGSGISEMSI